MGWELPAAVFAIAILFALFGALFIRRVSGGAMSARAAFLKPFKILVAPLHIARVAAVFILVVVGIAFLLAAPYYLTISTVTGYRYTITPIYGTLRYLDSVCVATGGYVPGGGDSSVVVSNACSFYERLTLDRAVRAIEVMETPVVSYTTVLHFRPDFVLFGLAFIIAGTILTAYFLTKINTEEAKAAGVWVEKP
jgi:hypothetical protein